MLRAKEGELQKLREVLLQILDALGATDAAGVLHRDLKTANILVDYEAGTLKPTLVDFGIARGAVHEGMDRETDHVAGTPKFMAPEQIRGDQRDEGPWTDLYALGCVAWRLVSGSPPFVREQIKEVLKAQLSEQPPALDAVSPVPDEFYDWLLWLLDKSVFERCKRAADAALALRELPDPPDPNWGRLIKASSSDQPSPGTSQVRDGLDFRSHMLPDTWRGLDDSDEHRRPTGAGLGLYGMRAIPVVDREEIRDHLWDRLRHRKAEGHPLATPLVGTNGCGKSNRAYWARAPTSPADARDSYERAAHFWTSCGLKAPYAAEDSEARVAEEP